MQAEIWRAASHSRFYTRYFRVFPGFLGLKSFLNFFKKRVLGPIFTLQSSSEVARRAVLPFPPHALCLPRTLCVRNFLKIFSCTASRQSDDRAVRSSDNQSSPAANSLKHPPQKRSQIPAPAPPKTKTPGGSKTQRQRKSPEANLGASVERLTRLELATSTLARWCSTN